ncbi:MAG: hypothetical protein AAF327_01875 [Cyanobacteria bacterium P01_A01_bin.37]
MTLRRVRAVSDAIANNRIAVADWLRPRRCKTRSGGRGLPQAPPGPVVAPAR